MNWDQVWTDGIAPALVADVDISPIMGEAIYLAGTREFEVPSLTALLIVDSETENWAPADWQFDVYGKTKNQVLIVARAVRLLFHRELQFDLGPFRLWGEFLEGRSYDGPDSDGYHRYSMDFRFTPGRSLYLTAQES